MNKRVIVWFRQDLRVHDNEALYDALRSSDQVIPVFIFDERLFRKKSKFGFPRIQIQRAQFIIDCVKDLSERLRSNGLDLIIRIGKPEVEIFEIAQKAKTNWVFCNRERTQEEVYVQDQLEQKLWSIGQEVRYSRGKMLYYTADLPFPVTHTPDVFTLFRKEVERIIPVRKPIECDFSNLTPVDVEIDSISVPNLKALGFDEKSIVLLYPGGETKAIKRLEYYIWESKLISSYKETRNDSFGMDYSSKFSMYLSMGCISPKFIYHEIKRYEEEHGANESTYWLFFELLWRDFFRLMAKKHGNKIFQAGGTKEKIDANLTDNLHLFQLWADARTGYPFIDAGMRELKSTGFMSNRARQNVASFLVHFLKVNWQMGAEYFESYLLDYDPCSNWGNWNYIAGVGSDPRDNRHFNPILQARKYDPEAIYIKHWCPELKELPATLAIFPNAASETELLEYDFILGRDYPKPILKLQKSITDNK